MYYKALIEGFPLPEACAATRKKLRKKQKSKAGPPYTMKLNVHDPVSAQRIHPNDPQRLIRALEVWYLTGQSMTALTQESAPPLPYRFLQFAIWPEKRADLHQKIEQRFQQMLQHGFVDEVSHLVQKYDLHADLPSMRSVGYRQCWQYLQGEFDYDEMVEQKFGCNKTVSEAANDLAEKLVKCRAS